MRCLLLGVLASGGCSPPGHSPDAGSGTDSACVSDSDGDGHCDAADVCPEVADPGQLDPDGDGIGWACDPTESFTFDTTTVERAVGSVSSAKVVATVGSCFIGGLCDQVVVAGDLQNAWIVASSSADPAHAWAATSPIENVVITADDQMLVSRRTTLNDGETLWLDPTTKEAIARGPALDRYLREGRGAPVLLSFAASGSQPSTLVEPRNGGDLAIIASVATGRWFETLFSYLTQYDTWATESSPLVAMRLSTQSPTPATLQQFVPGTNALVDLNPAVNAAQQVTRLRLGRGAPWCVLQGATAALYEPTASGLRRIALPFTTCGLQSFSFPGTELLVGVSTDVDGDGEVRWTAVFVRDGVARTVFEDEVPTNHAVRPYGRDIVVLATRPYDTQLDAKVWAIWPDHAVSLLTEDLAAVDVSIGGNTIHVIGVEAEAGATGALVVRRFKQGQATESAELTTGVSASYSHRVVTSIEGAAIASDFARGWIAPSAALTFTLQPGIENIVGGARRNHTVVLSGIESGTGPSTGAAYAYDEVAGQPRLTRLIDDTSDFDGGLVDVVGPQESEFFFLSPPCSFGRIRLDANGTPKLESASCAFTGLDAVEVVAVTRQGETVVGNTFVAPATGLRLNAISESGVRKIANGASVTPVLDRTTNPPTMVGWVSYDNFEAYACVEESPPRCWSVPGQMTLLDSRVEGTSPEVVSMLLFKRVGTTNQLTVVRSIGPGNAIAP